MAGEGKTPLDGLQVVAHASGVAAAYTARLLGTMGSIFQDQGRLRPLSPAVRLCG